jgi:hypothetical protein
MTFRILLSVVAGLVLLAAGYFGGYVRGHRVAMHDEVIFDLRHGLTLYRLEQRGDTNQLESKLRFSIYAYSDYYDRHFGSEKVTYEGLAKDLAEARMMAGQERTNVVVFTKASLIRQVNDAIKTNETNP